MKVKQWRFWVHNKASKILILLLNRPVSLHTSLCPSLCARLCNVRFVTSKGQQGQCSTIGPVCACWVPGDKELSLISIICFPDGRVRVRGKPDERTRPAGWHSFCHAALAMTPEAKISALTGDTRALVGFIVRERELRDLNPTVQPFICAATRWVTSI